MRTVMRFEPERAVCRVGGAWHALPPNVPITDALAKTADLLPPEERDAGYLGRAFFPGGRSYRLTGKLAAVMRAEFPEWCKTSSEPEPVERREGHVLVSPERGVQAHSKEIDHLAARVAVLVRELTTVRQELADVKAELAELKERMPRAPLGAA